MAIILNKRPAALSELEGAVGSIAGAMRLRSELDDRKESRKRQKEQDARQEKLDALHESLLKSQERRSDSADARASEDQAREAALFPAKQREQEARAQGAEYGLERAKVETSREDAKFETGKNFWAEVAAAKPEQIGDVAKKYLAGLPDEVQAFAYDEIRRQKRSQVFDQRAQSAADAIERAMKDGVFNGPIDAKGNATIDPNKANDVAAMAQGLAEWRDLATSGDPAAEEVARRHPYSPDNVERDILAQRAKRTKEAAEQTSNVETIQMLDNELAQLSPVLFPIGSPQREAARLLVEGFRQQVPSADGSKRAGTMQAFSNIFKSVASGAGKAPDQQTIDLGTVKIPRDPGVPMEGVDWSQATEQQRARLDGYAEQSLMRKRGTTMGEPTPEQVAVEAKKIARSLGWTNTTAPDGPKLRTLDDLTGRERKAMESEAAAGATPEQLAKKYRIDPNEPIGTAPAKLKPIGDVPKAKKFQVGKVLKQAVRSGMTGLQLGDKLRELGVDPESVRAMSPAEQKALLEQVDANAAPSVLDEFELTEDGQLVKDENGNPVRKKKQAREKDQPGRMQ